MACCHSISSAAPVGVTSSTVSLVCSTGCPSSNAAVAGAGRVTVRMGDQRGVIELENMRWARKPNPDIAYYAARIRRPSQALAVGDVIQRKGMEFAYVRLRPAVMEDSIIEVITAPQVHLLAWVDEGTTRTDFLDVLEIEDAAENPHGGEGSGEGQDA